MIDLYKNADSKDIEKYLGVLVLLRVEIVVHEGKQLPNQAIIRSLNPFTIPGLKIRYLWGIVLLAGDIRKLDINLFSALQWIITKKTMIPLVKYSLRK